ncbi:hypothetical protein B9Z65_762 [Elsinoe australis]|uniref:Meiotically up-regulated protein Msb1/Mug8 domain-containing protein n=1 Tax=Elsinoe australis TaxID=40998 RepID=A0A2P8AJG1_9PEZI|nr:hypothetical protein B9Z65_762 [Elsinoe australis]
MPFFSRLKRKETDKNAKKLADQANGQQFALPKPRYASNWDSTEVVMEEVEELLSACTKEMKSRAEALDTPFLLLPFRPEGDITSARTFIRNYFKANKEASMDFRGESLSRELRLTEPEILCSIVKWCWSRIPNGVVTWAIYENFRAGEKESGMAINSFDTFIPLAVESESRKNIIYDFFDLISAIAAHGKVNGMGGRKLSRMAGWWAFEQSDKGKGFDGGYRSWAEAADASSHLFFAYLRSRAPEAVNGIAGISNLPRSLQALVAQTEYPPETPTLMQSPTAKVLMQVDSVSPTPFALLRRARLFEYRADDRALKKFAEYTDPVDALTEECKRVLSAISSTNQSSTARSRRTNLADTRLPSGLSIKSVGDDSWSRFQDEGFASQAVDSAAQSPQAKSPISNRDSPPYGGYANLQARSQSRLALGGRPTTPSWADFLNTGFVEDGKNPSTPALLLRPDQQLPPIGDRTASTAGSLDEDDDLEPGELASITRFELDDSFWWVWMTSLASEETTKRKAAFGRCAMAETSISGGRWLLLEEQVKGASPPPAEGAYVAEKKSRFGFTRRNRSTRRKDTKKADPAELEKPTIEPSQSALAKGSISPDQKAKISAAAAELARKNSNRGYAAERRGRFDDGASTKTNSIMTLGLTREASPAMKWATAYDKETVRKQYLGDNFAGKGNPVNRMSQASSVYDEGKENENPAQLPPPAAPEKPTNRSKPLPPPQAVSRELSENVLPAPLPPKPPVVTVDPPEAQSQAASAAAVPLPSAATPALQKSPSQVSLPGRKPLPEAAVQHVHPAFRSQAVDVRTQTPSPAPEDDEAKVSPNSKKLQKKPAGSAGFKKMFGRKKDDPKRASADLAGFLPPKDAGERKPSSAAAVPVVPPESRRREVPQSVPTLEPSTIEERPMSEAQTLSTVNTQERQEAQTEFSRFDQGPLDAPAFVPRDSIDSASVTSPAVATFEDRGVEGNMMQTPQVEKQNVFARSQQALVTSDAVSEISAQDEPAPAVSHSDRWAQIRKNAAERAARQSEEQSTRSQGQSVITDRTDDGETSGEETIEERVARIKARVAQLTGNPERR